MRGGVVALIVALLGGGACASPPPPEPSPGPLTEAILERPDTEVERAFLRGLVALKLGDYVTARREIGGVAYACSRTPVGARALLTLASVELDPRNSAGDPRTARLLVERYFELPERPAWTEPAAQTLYLMAVELDVEAAAAGTPDEDAPPNGTSNDAPNDTSTVADVPERRSAGPVPGTSRPGTALHEEECAAAREEYVAGTLQRPTLPRVPLAARTHALEVERDSLRTAVEHRERQLAELRQELERIRETLRP